MVFEGLSGGSQISMDCLPMAKKGIVVDGINLIEKDGDFDAWLIIRLGGVVEL
jgi:hypothetical protein